MHYEIQVLVQDRVRKRDSVRETERMKEDKRLGEKMIGRETIVEEGRVGNIKL